MSKIGSVPPGVFDNRFGRNSNLRPVPAPIVAFGFAHATQVMMIDVTPLLQGPERLEATPACVCAWEGDTAVMVPQWVALHKNVSAEVRLDADLMKRRV